MRNRIVKVIENILIIAKRPRINAMLKTMQEEYTRLPRRVAQRTAFFFPSKHQRSRALDYIEYRLQYGEQKGQNQDAIKRLEFRFLHTMDEWYVAQVTGGEVPKISFLKQMSCIPSQPYKVF